MMLCPKVGIILNLYTKQTHYLSLRYSLKTHAPAKMNMQRSCRYGTTLTAERKTTLNLK